MCNSLQLFIEKALDDSALIACLNEIMTGGVESIEVPKDESKYFIQLLQFSGEFATGLNISWAPDTASDINEIDLITKLAKKLSSKIIWEATDQGEWLLSNSDGKVAPVRVVELEDGLAIEK